MGGTGGEGGTFYLHHQLCFTRWSDSCHSTGSDSFMAFCSQQPFRVYWGDGGRGGTFYLHHQLCVTRWNDSCHPTGSYFFMAFCSQEPFRVYWDGGRGEGGNILLPSSASFVMCHYTSSFFGLMLIAAI